MPVSDGPGTMSLLMPRLSFPPPEEGEGDLGKVGTQCMSKENKLI